MSTRIESRAEPIPGYRLMERLGGGGFGEVWKAEAPGGLHKAIKFVYGDLGSAGDNGQRAEQELKALNRVKTVRHPYILSLERIEIIDGQLMIVMELADRSLWDRFRECRAQGMPGIPREELMSCMEETAEALDLMNGEHNLQHLDIKPQNIFLVHQHVKVADFGLVKDLEGMQASVTGGVTPVYAAPEIFDGKVSRFSDQYSLAIVYQELLTGQRPFNGTNIRQLILQHMQSAPNLSSLPAADQPVIGRALAKVANDRFPMCKDMVTLLRRNTGVVDAVAPSRRAEVLRPPEIPPATPPLEDLATNPEMPTHMMRPRSELEGLSGRDAPAFEILGPTAEGAAAVPAPAELRGDGCLFPAVVVGIGQVGMLALQRLRAELHDHFGSPSRVPNVRLLLIDTDPAVMQAATRERQGTALSAAEVLLAPLNRPSHYLKPHDGKPGVENWLNPRMLYRIPRSQVPSGVRALGRLAFCDNFRSITRRLRQELQHARNYETLKRSADETQLGVRSNRPRVYVLAGLAGGTGGGMFLDLAYTVRSLLKGLGYDQPDVVGMFFVPPLEGHGARGMILGNTYAAITELTYFGTPGSTFEARYLDKDGTVADNAPPFTRTILVNLPEESDEAGSDAVLRRTARTLFNDLCSPLGRAADLTRAGLSAPRWDLRGLCYQTVGLHQIAWPRRELMRLVARKLCHRLVHNWMSKDGKPIRIAAQAWVDQQMEERELGADRFIRRLDDECAKALGEVPEESFHEILRPLTARLTPEAEKTPPKSKSGSRPAAKSAAAQELPTEAYAVPLKLLGELIGRPGDEGSETPCKVVPVLREAAERLANEWGHKLAELHVRLFERPGFRLAGAEEGIRHVVASVEKSLQHYEPLLRDLKEKAAEAFAHLEALASGSKNGRRHVTPPQELLELLKSYPKWRYQSLVMQQVITALVGLRGHLSDELREVNFCRVRLTELQTLLEAEGSASAGAAVSAPGAVHLYPAGCKNLQDAAKVFLGEIDNDALVELDGRVQALLKKDFVALVQVCLSNGGTVLKNLEAAMRHTAEAFTAEKLHQSDVAEMFLEQHPDQDDAVEQLRLAYEDCGSPPAPSDMAKSQFSVLAAPAGSAGDQVREWFRTVATDVEMATGPSDAMLIYRETPYQPLGELEQLGPAARDAYEMMCNAENFTPHTRTDVAFHR
jgi:hypothetical protein